MNCRKIAALFSDIYDDTAGVEIRKEFFVHIETCISCKKGYDNYSGILMKIPTLQVVDAPDIEQAVLSKIEHIKEKEVLSEQFDEVYRSYKPVLRHNIDFKQIFLSAGVVFAVFVAGFLLNYIIGLSGSNNNSNDNANNLILEQLPGIISRDKDNNILDIADNNASKAGVCCNVPYSQNSIEFARLNFSADGGAALNNLYLATTPIKINETIKVYLISGDPCEHSKCLDNKTFVQNAYKENYVDTKSGMADVIPLSLVNRGESEFKEDTLAYFREIVMKREHDFDFFADGEKLFEYFTFLVRKLRGIVVAYGSNIHSILLCADTNCLFNTYQYYLASNYLDYLLSDYLVFEWDSAFSAENVQDALRSTTERNESAGRGLVFKRFYNASFKLPSVEQILDSITDADSRISGFNFKEEAFYLPLYISLVNRRFKSLSAMTRKVVKKTLFEMYSSGDENLESIVLNIYPVITGKKQFVLEEFYSWVDR